MSGEKETKVRVSQHSKSEQREKDKKEKRGTEWTEIKSREEKISGEWREEKNIIMQI